MAPSFAKARPELVRSVQWMPYDKSSALASLEDILTKLGAGVAEASALMIFVNVDVLQYDRQEIWLQAMQRLS